MAVYVGVGNCALEPGTDYITYLVWLLFLTLDSLMLR